MGIECLIFFVVGVPAHGMEKSTIFFRHYAV